MAKRTRPTPEPDDLDPAAVAARAAQVAYRFPSLHHELHVAIARVELRTGDTVRFEEVDEHRAARDRERMERHINHPGPWASGKRKRPDS